MRLQQILTFIVSAIAMFVAGKIGITDAQQVSVLQAAILTIGLALYAYFAKHQNTFFDAPVLTSVLSGLFLVGNAALKWNIPPEAQASIIGAAIVITHHNMDTGTGVIAQAQQGTLNAKPNG
jgi:hypothetical protein